MRLLQLAAEAVNGLITSGTSGFVIKMMKEVLHFGIQFAVEDADDNDED